MKKVFKVIIFVAVALAAIWVLYFYWQNLRGVSPAIKKPSQDIVELLKQTITAENKTDIPLKIPLGFSISIYAKDLDDPRVLTQDNKGHLLVSIPSQGKIVALIDIDNNGEAEEKIVIAENLNRPHGLAIDCENDDKCKLYIAENDQVAVYDYDSANLKTANKKKIIDLPKGGIHFTRTLMFFNDQLLISVGSSCNVCIEDDWRRGKILIADKDGSNLNVFALGLRNAVFMALHPSNGKIWATEMGRDLLGDDLPPDEINIIEEGKNYGWPICYGKNIHDTDFDKNTYIRNPCMEPFETASHIDIPAHSAPLGLVFFPRDGWPEEYQDDLLVAYHGSWNRTEPTGYKIVRYKLDEQGNYLGDGSTSSPQGEDFITSWLLNDGTTLGRPVDILISPERMIYISDDKAGVIYKVEYNG